MPKRESGLYSVGQSEMRHGILRLWEGNVCSFCCSALASLDNSCALFYESLEKLKAAQPVNTTEAVEQLTTAAESARKVRELVWSELPHASWQSRGELDALVDEIQKIVIARALEQQRSRLLALATELESGSIVHRRAIRVSELNQLREHAIEELRFQAGSEAPQALPGPQAGQWIVWACGLQEGQDAEPLQALHKGYPHLDDLVANLELSMWGAAPPTVEVLPEAERSAGTKQPEPSLLSDRMLSPTQPLNEAPDAAPSVGTGAHGSELPAMADALASLNHALAKPYESLEKLKAAQPVNTTEAIEQLTTAAESARKVRELVCSELPHASWQSRGELDALVDGIQKIVIARALEQQRSRLLALATELESGSIVHRRAIRVSDLNQLREHAIEELRFQAGSEAPQTLAGPQAGQWIVWACGLQEAQDAEPLQALHRGYPHLDDFVANLELSMWVAAPPTVEVLPQAERSAGTKQPEPSLREANRSEEPVVSVAPPQIECKITKSSGNLVKPRFPDLPDELRPREFESNTLTPYDVTPPRTEEQSQEMQAQELALLAGMMDWITDPVGRYNDTVERARTAEVSRETSVTAVADASEPVGHFSGPAARPSTAFLSGDAGAAVANAREPVGDLRPPVEGPLPAEVRREGSSAQAIPSRTRSEVTWPWSGNSRMLIVLAAGLGLAALGTILWGLGATLFRSEKSHVRNEPGKSASKSPVKTVEQRVPGLTQGNPQPKPVTLLAIPTDSATRANTATTSTHEQPKPEKQGVSLNSLSKAGSSKQADGRVEEFSRTPSVVSGSITTVASQGPPLGSAADEANLPPPVLPNLDATNVPSNVRDIPVAPATVAIERPKISSEAAQGSLIRQVNPLYPPKAVQAQVEGTVVLQVVIGKDGSVQDLHALSGSPLLIPAAMDAVRQWRYKPYKSHGEPVEAETQINVKFTLNK